MYVGCRLSSFCLPPFGAQVFTGIEDGKKALLTGGCICSSARWGGGLVPFRE